ncbi:MAG: transcriptional regulator [SAR202 cluster bacterium MP-SInd-SRR3963457-G2]|nr:MAG: transcriptional regulator [SAR202 cluster bacterium MP-SInd-SRR3963457-G2]
MYVPRHYAVTDRQQLHDFIKGNGFGIMFSGNGPEPVASHLPFILDESAGEQGTLLSHMAGANRQWRHADGQQVLTVFQGPHTYVSPTWYQDPETVPTWNYVAVHVYGILKVVQDQERIQNILARITDYYEASLPQPWQAEFTSEYAQQMVKRIVAFEIEIDKMQGKWKLNQNHPEERRRRVVDVLKTMPDDNSQGIVTLMEPGLDSKDAGEG